MIHSFRDKDTETLFQGQRVRRFEAVKAQAERRLQILDSATSLADLAGLPSNPSQYDPALHFSTATQRFETILSLMVSQGYITRVQAQDAMLEEQDPQFFKTAVAVREVRPGV